MILYYVVCLGMLSKSRGQILRIAAVLHVLFHLDTPQNIPTNIADNAVTAAIDFVELCIQHVMYIMGRHSKKIPTIVHFVIKAQNLVYVLKNAL